MLFRAKIALRSVCDITPQLLEKLGVCGLLLDIDNTLTTHDNPVPAAGVEAWVAGMQAAGISLCPTTTRPVWNLLPNDWGWTSSAREKSR